MSPRKKRHVARSPEDLARKRDAILDAAMGLLVLGPDADAEEPLIAALADPAPNVRFAAAEVLCKSGRADEAVPVLVEGLRHSDARVRLAAAIALAGIGEHARPAVEEMERTIAGHDRQGDYPMFIRWSLEQTLRKLGER